jgi:hypothetical protein
MGYRWLEPCAVKVARTVLRRGGGSNPFSLFDYITDRDVNTAMNLPTHASRLSYGIVVDLFQGTIG